MRFLPTVIPFLAVALLLSPGLATQPIAVTDTFVVSPMYSLPPEDDFSVEEPAVAALGPDIFAVIWVLATWTRDDYTDEGDSSIEGRLVDASGQVGPDFHGADAFTSGLCPAIAPTRGGGFILANVEWFEGGSALMAQRFGTGSTSLGDAAYVHDWEDEVWDGCPAVVARTGGRFAIAWPQTHYSDDRETISTLLLQVFLESGEPVGDPVPVDRLQLPPNYWWAQAAPPALGMDRTGGLLLVWWSVDGSLRGQWFRSDGSALGAIFPVAETAANTPALAMAPDGSFAVAWVGTAPKGTPRPLLLRRFAADGTPACPVMEVDRGLTAAPLAAADPHGNFALFWSGKMQLFNRALVPQGERVNAGAADSLALSSSGQLLLASNRYYTQIQGRLWRARHEADLCVYRQNRFLCDTAGDATSEKAPAEAIPFGLGRPFHTPLLGDLDGDGRADPCVRHGGVFICDTAHDGGAGEVRIRFGRANDIPLLQDVNGDHFADPCVRRGGLLLCDTAHNGGAAELTLAFGQAGEPLLLGDVDGDGRADSCVARDGLFLCDTAHDGGAPETTLDLRAALAGVRGGIPLLGDVDGDGRADACIERGGSLLCGIFGTGGGAPLAVLERPTFVRPGDVPFLGDLDAF